MPTIELPQEYGYVFPTIKATKHPMEPIPSSPELPLQCSPQRSLANTLPSFVLLSAVSTFLVGSYLGGRVTAYRKEAKIPYPYEYASYEQVQTASPERSKALDAFNRAQRGHQNFNENHVSFLGSLLISGLQYPRAAAVMGAVWSVNRVVYALGYNNGSEGGKGRYYGALWMVVHYLTIGLAGKAAWDFAMA